MKARIVSKVQAYVAPKLFGGSGRSPVSGTGVPTPDMAFMLEKSRVSHIGEDILIEKKKKKCSQE